MKTKAKTMRTKLNKVKEWIKQERNRKPFKEIWKILQSKLRGHVQYYGISHNIEQVEIFIYGAIRIVFKWLNRRSQRKSFTWESLALFYKANPLPEAKIVHRLF